MSNSFNDEAVEELSLKVMWNEKKNGKMKQNNTDRKAEGGEQ